MSTPRTEKHFESLATTIVIHTNPGFEKKVHEALNQIKSMIDFTLAHDTKDQPDLFAKD